MSLSRWRTRKSTKNIATLICFWFSWKKMTMIKHVVQFNVFADQYPNYLEVLFISVTVLRIQTYQQCQPIVVSTFIGVDSNMSTDTLLRHMDLQLSSSVKIVRTLETVIAMRLVSLKAAEYSIMPLEYRYTIFHWYCLPAQAIEQSVQLTRCHIYASLHKSFRFP